MKKYALRYTWIPEIREEGFEPGEVDTRDQGLADALVGISIVYQLDGSLTQQTFSFDGLTGKALSSIELFKAWALFGMGLQKNHNIKGWQQKLLDNHANFMIKKMRSKRP